MCRADEPWASAQKEGFSVSHGASRLPPNDFREWSSKPPRRQGSEERPGDRAVQPCGWGEPFRRNSLASWARREGNSGSPWFPITRDVNWRSCQEMPATGDAVRIRTKHCCCIARGLLEVYKLGSSVGSNLTQRRVHVPLGWKLNPRFGGDQDRMDRWKGCGMDSRAARPS